MSSTESPGNVVKWPRWIARRRVATIGLKRHAWRNVARSALVEAARMALAAVSFMGRGGGLEVFICSPLLSEGLANAPIAGHSLIDVILGELDEHLGEKGSTRDGCWGRDGL